MAYTTCATPKNGKRVWEKIGADPQLTFLVHEKKYRMIEALAVGVAIADEDSKPKILLAEDVAAYLEDVRCIKSAETAEAYRETMRGFAESTGKKYLNDLARKDVLGQMAYLREKNNVPRTVHNRLIFLRTFLR